MRTIGPGPIVHIKGAGRLSARNGAALLLLALALPSLPVAAGPRADLPSAPSPDFGFYERHIAPWVERTCVECHRAGGSSLRLAEPALGLPERERRRRDFEQIRAYVSPEAPWDSVLLLKVLEPADGGGPHVGGAFVRAETDEHDALLDFVSGATLTNLPPETWLGEDRRAKPGETVTVDGSGSYDRDREDVLHYRWSLLALPPGSRTGLSDVRGSHVAFTPDLGGTYVLGLRVSDGKVWSASRSVAVEVYDRVEATDRAPGAISGLEKVDPEAMRRIRRLYLDLLGRPPTPAEVIAEEHAVYSRLVQTMGGRVEAGRAWYEEMTARLGLVQDARPAGQEAQGLALRLVAEGTPPQVAEGILARDPSFLKVHPPGRALAEALAEDLLGRPATPAEVAASLLLAEGRPADVPGLGVLADAAAWVRRVTESEAFREAAVRRRLARFLPSGGVERALPKGVAAAAEGAGPWKAFLEQVLGSTDYVERRALRAKDPLTFLRGLYLDLLERKPTDRELHALLASVRVLPGRSAPLAALAKVLLDSGEAPLPLLVDIPDAPAWITDRFLRYLGRKPVREEMEAYGKALLDPAGGPETVVRALLTSPEYACR